MNVISSLPEWLVYSFLIIGACTVGILIIFLIIDIVKYIKAEILAKVYSYKVKHRFDKPPLAKCYCRDCKNWQIRYGNGDTAKCHIANRYTGDNCFCYYATPRKKDPESQ